jgi:hypothetical protein
MVVPNMIGKMDSTADSLRGKRRESRFPSTTTPAAKSSSDKTASTTAATSRRPGVEFSGAEFMGDCPRNRGHCRTAHDKTIGQQYIMRRVTMPFTALLQHRDPGTPEAAPRGEVDPRSND